MTSYNIDKPDLIDFSDVTLDYFWSIIDRYPNLVFTNIDAAGRKKPKVVWIYPKNLPRRGNVFIEVWQHKDRFDFVMKKSLMNEEELVYVAKHDRKPSSLRGTVKRCMTYRRELLDFLIPKLDMIEAAK